MAVVRFFRERPVKKMHQDEAGNLVLIFYGPHGQPGPRRVVTQAEWDAAGDKRFLLDEEATPDKLRALAAALPPLPES